MIDYDIQDRKAYERTMERLSVRSAIELSHPENYVEAYSEEFLTEALKLGLIIPLPDGLKSSASLLKSFLALKHFEGCQVSTLNGYYGILNHFLYSLQMNPLSVKPADIRSYLITYQQNHNCSNRTIDNMRLCLSSFYSWLEDESYIMKNPMKKIKKIKFDKTIQKPFTDEEMQQIIDACTNYRDLSIIEFLYSTGCRVSEIVAIDITDIDFAQREIIIRGKGKKERVVYFNAKTKIHIIRYISQRSDKNPALFVTARYPNKRLTKADIEFICKEVGKRAGVEHCHPHRFRRTLATNLIDKEVPIEQVQTILGHEKIDTTLIYAKVNQSNVKSSHRKYV